MILLYKGWGPGAMVAPKLAVENDVKNRLFGWLLAEGPDGQWVSVADLKPICIKLVMVQAQASGEGK